MELTVVVRMLFSSTAQVMQQEWLLMLHPDLWKGGKGVGLYFSDFSTVALLLVASSPSQLVAH